MLEWWKLNGCWSIKSITLNITKPACFLFECISSLTHLFLIGFAWEGFYCILIANIYKADGEFLQGPSVWCTYVSNDGLFEILLLLSCGVNQSSAWVSAIIKRKFLWSRISWHCKQTWDTLYVSFLLPFFCFCPANDCGLEARPLLNSFHFKCYKTIRKICGMQKGILKVRHT